MALWLGACLSRGAPSAGGWMRWVRAFGLRTHAHQAERLGNDKQHEKRVLRVAPPKATRLGRQTKQPLEAAALNPARRLRLAAREKIKGGAHTEEHRRREAIAVVGHPAFLRGRRETHPDNIRLGVVDSLNGLLILGLRLRAEGGRGCARARPGT